MKQQIKQMGRTMRMSVCFADLTDFSSIAEELGAKGAVEMLQQAFEWAGNVIIRHDGRIRKYLGDAILFTFPDPAQAVAAARQIAAEFRLEVGSLTLRFRVAVASGEVVVTEIGHPSHRVEDIFGQPVSRAARLLKRAHRSRSAVAFCEETRRLVRI